MARLTAVVVEDHPLARDHIVSMLEQLDVNVLAACANGREAVERIPELSPDVVFLDVQMPELDGFEVIEAIGPDLMPPVVFITAFDHYMMEAFGVFAFGYLLKPVAPDRLRKVVDRLSATVRQNTAPQRTRAFRDLLERARPPGQVQRLLVRTDGRLTFVSVNDVSWIEAAGNYAVLHASGGTHIMREPLTSLARRLAPAFARIHRSALVNLRHVMQLRLVAHGECDVELRGGTVLRVTRRFRPQLQQQLRDLP